AAMAPDDTSTHDVPVRRRPTKAVASALMLFWSSPPSGLVSDDDPILMTTLRAAVTTSRAAAVITGSPTVEARVSSPRPDAVLSTRQHAGLPVERHIADHNFVARLGARL